MARRLRYMPPEGSGLVEVTTRTVHGRFLLAPSAELNDLILGALGRAQELYPINLVAFAFASGHYHLLLRVDDTRQPSSFMNHFNSNLAREAGRLADWREKFWSRRFQAIPISDEPLRRFVRWRGDGVRAARPGEGELRGQRRAGPSRPFDAGQTRGGMGSRPGCATIFQQ